MLLWVARAASITTGRSSAEILIDAIIHSADYTKPSRLLSFTAHLVFARATSPPPPSPPLYRILFLRLIRFSLRRRRRANSLATTYNYRMTLAYQLSTGVCIYSSARSFEGPKLANQRLQGRIKLCRADNRTRINHFVPLIIARDAQ